ncbi:MAG TPA: hypothetical protein VF692_12420, partial [Pyrinomonadaceae bacterium]
MKKINLPIAFLSFFLFLPVVFCQGRQEIERLEQSQKANESRNGRDENGMIKQPPSTGAIPQTSAELKEIYARKAKENEEKLIALKEAEQRLLPPPQYYEK